MNVCNVDGAAGGSILSFNEEECVCELGLLLLDGTCQVPAVRPATGNPPRNPTAGTTTRPAVPDYDDDYVAPPPETDMGGSMCGEEGQVVCTGVLHRSFNSAGFSCLHVCKGCWHRG